MPSVFLTEPTLLVGRFQTADRVAPRINYGEYVTRSVLRVITQTANPAATIHSVWNRVACDSSKIIQHPDAARLLFEGQQQYRTEWIEVDSPDMKKAAAARECQG